MAECADERAGFNRNFGAENNEKGENVSIELITLLYFLCLFLGLFLGLPVALGLGGTAVLFAAIFEPRSLLAIPSAFYYTPWNGVLVTVPLFLFMGTMMQTSGIAERAFKILHKWMGLIRR